MGRLNLVSANEVSSGPAGAKFIFVVEATFGELVMQKMHHNLVTSPTP